MLGALAVLLAVALAPAAAPAAEEPPSLLPQVTAGTLPPLARRLPEHPLVMRADPEAVYGGELRTLIGTPKDTKLLSVYGYARLVRFDASYRLVPDILEAFEVEEGRVFTFHLRKGHRWSDGAPFTTADFAYWWEHVANDKDLSPSGPPAGLLVDGVPPAVEIIDPWTIRYRWPKPNNLFLLDQAGAYPTTLYRPAHYLKQFHRAFTDLPTLQPWRQTTAPPAQVYVAERNPYYHRVDQRGRQLPYIDRITMILVDKSVIPVKASTGDADLQARYLSFDEYTFLRQNERAAGYRVLLWSTAMPASVALYPNLTTTDPVMRPLLRDRRFRQALSLAINRDEINKILYYGFAIVGQNTVLRSPAPMENGRMAYARHDPAQANRLLDEMGLTRRDSRGYRLRPDGRRLDIIVDTSGESNETADVLELIRDDWTEIGVELLARPSQLEVFRRRVFSGEAVMSAYYGNFGFGLPTPDMNPDWLAPVSIQHLQWSRWGRYYETKGKQGEPPALPEARRLVTLYDRWLVATSREERARIWAEMLDINASEVFTIGVVGGALQPIVVKNGLRGVPEKGVYAWDPGAHFGLYSPDTFYWQNGHR